MTAVAEEEFSSKAAECAAVTRQSTVLGHTSGMWAQVVASAIRGQDDDAFVDALESFSQQVLRRLPNPRITDASTVTACYLQQSLPGLIDMTAKYTGNSNGENVWQGLLANANVGGENVHRGSVLGAILGARAGASKLPQRLIQGLYPRAELEKEIDSFVKAVLP